MSIYYGNQKYNIISGTPKAGIIPSGVLRINTNQTQDITAYAYIDTYVPTGNIILSTDIISKENSVLMPSGLLQSSQTITKSTATTELILSKVINANNTATITLNNQIGKGYNLIGTQQSNSIEVSASELVTGSYTATKNDTYNILNYKNIIINIPYYNGEME